MGCGWQHNDRKLSTLVRHLDTDHAQWLSTAWIRNLYVQEVVTKETKVAFCECGKFWENTEEGQREHRLHCEHASMLASYARMNIDNERCMPGRLAVDTLPVQVNDARQFTLGSGSPLEAVECGAGVEYTETTEQGERQVIDGNCCFYLSACQAKLETCDNEARLQGMRRAVALKRKLGHAAVAIARERGRQDINFLNPLVMAEEEVLLAHAKLVGPIVVIKHHPGNLLALRYHDPEATGEVLTNPVVYVLHLPGHYKMLRPVNDATVWSAELRREIQERKEKALQKSAPRPAPVRAPIIDGQPAPVYQVR